MISPHSIRPYFADRLVRSPNHGARSGRGVSLIILHATADGGHEAGAEAWMANPKSQASCHLHIRRDGSVTRMVGDSRKNQLRLQLACRSSLMLSSSPNQKVAPGLMFQYCTSSR